MEKYILSRWEAIDLFVRIISKYEKKDKQEIERDLLSYLAKYRRADKSTEVAKIVLMPIADARFGSQNYYPKFLSDLSSEIENSVPTVRTLNRIYLMLEYIGESKLLNRYKLDSQSDQKRESLIGSYWWMYTHEYYIDRITNQRVMYITRDYVSLNPFAYVTLSATKNHEGKTVGSQDYSGHYYTKNNRYLFLDLHISETREKDLRVVVDIGTGNSAIGEVFTGYYLNASNNLYFGPVLLERIFRQDEPSASNFLKDDPGLDVKNWEYFDGLNSIPYKVSPTYGSRGQLGRFLDL